MIERTESTDPNTTIGRATEGHSQDTIEAPADTVARDPNQTFEVDAVEGTRTFEAGADALRTSPLRLPAGKKADLPNIQIPGYEILGVLGRGGMGVVFKARQIKANRTVALKVMLNSKLADRDARERFDAEATSIARMQHQNIVQVFDVGEVDGNPYFSQEFVTGGTLSAKLKATLLAPRDAAKLMVILARAMGYAHRQNVIHRDLKPDNILLSEFGEPKIADFGLARQLESDVHLTRAGTIFGTPSYMPPEQASGDPAQMGPSADIYSLGAVFYELLTGRVPFKGASIWDIIEQVRNSPPPPPSLLQPKVPRDLETICLKCLAKLPAGRYATADDLGDDLQRYLDGKPIHARPASRLERTVSWCRRNPWPTAMFGVMLLVTAGAVYAALSIDKQRKLAEKRLELVRGAVDGFVNEAEEIGLDSPQAAEFRSELRDLSGRLIDGLKGEQSLGTIDDFGRYGMQLRNGEAERDLGNWDDATALLSAARNGFQSMIDSQVAERDKARNNLATVMRSLASLEIKRADASKETEKQYDSAAAEGYLRESIRLRRDILASPGGDLKRDTVQRSLADSLGWLASWLNSVDRIDEAIANYEESVVLLDGIDATKLKPRDRQLVVRASIDHGIELGRLQAKRGDLAACRRSFERARRTVDAELAANKDSAPLRLRATSIGGLFGDHLIFERSDPSEALKLYHYSQGHLLAVLGDQQIKSYHDLVGLNYYRLGLAAQRVGEADASKRYFQRCLDWREIRVRDLEDAKSPPTGSVMILAKVDRMLGYARCGQRADASKTARGLPKLAELASDKEFAANLCKQSACGFAICSTAVPDGSEEQKADRTSAMQSLDKALGFGFGSKSDDRDFIERDPDLDGLRGWTEFEDWKAKFLKATAK